MATSGNRSDDKGNNPEYLMKWPLEYVIETEEYICGWCGQVLMTNHATKNLEMHYASCKNPKDNGLLMVFKELRKMNQKFEMLNSAISEIQNKEEKLKTEVMEETEAKILNIKTEFKKEILDIKKNLEKEIKNRKVSDAALSNKFYTFEEGTNKTLREMGLAQAIKLAEVSGRVSGMTETISTVVHSITSLEVKGKGMASANCDEPAPLVKESDALGMQGGKNEQITEILKSPLKTGQVKTKKQGLPLRKRRLEDEQKKNEAASKKSPNKKKKSFQQTPSTVDQSIPNQLTMNCFNLVTEHDQFHPSYVWKIYGIKSIAAQNMFHMSSQVFQWTGYPVQARAKLQPKENDWLYLSLRLEDMLKDNEKPIDFAPIPQVYYLLKYSGNNKCSKMGYLFNIPFKCSLGFTTRLCQKSLFSGREGKISNDFVEIEIYVEPFQMTQQVQSYDGTLEWKIENYKKRLQLEKGKLVLYQESPYFYTGPSGYRVQVRIFLNGVKGGGGPTANIVFMTGKFDAELPKAFPHSTTVTWMNHKDPEKNISKTILEDIKYKREYWLELCKVEEIKNFIENDTLLCKVSVKAQ